MSISIIESALNSFPGLLSLVSTRIYRVRIPQVPIYPLIKYEVGNDVQNTLNGESSLKHYNIDFMIKSKSYTLIESIKEQLFLALDASNLFSYTCTRETDSTVEDELDVYTYDVSCSIWF